MWVDDVIIKLNSKVKWRLSQKLTLLIGLLLLSLLITGFFAIFTLSVFNNTFRKTLDLNIKRTLIAAEMNDDLMRYDRLVVEYIRSQYQADRQKIEKELAMINRHFSSAIIELKQLKQDSTNNAILSELEPSWQEYDQTVRKILVQAKNNDLENAMELWDGWASVRYRDLKYLIKEVIDFNSELAQSSKLKADRSLRSLLLGIVLIVITTSVLAVILGMLIIRYLQISLHKLILANERVSQGNLSQGLDLAISFTPQDELAELAESNRKVVESIKKMVDDVTTLTEKYGRDESGLAEELDQKQFNDLINMEKTLGLVQDLTQSLELVKHEIEQVCKSELINPGLEEAHHRTLITLDNLNKGILKLHKVMVNIGSESFSKRIEKYGPTQQIGDLKLKEIIHRLEKISSAVINTLEVIKFGLLDQKMLLDSRDNPLNNTDTNNYFANLAKAIRKIIIQAEATSAETQLFQSSLPQINQTIAKAKITDNADPVEPFQDINEFEVLLDKLEEIMNGSSK